MGVQLARAAADVGGDMRSCGGGPLERAALLTSTLTERHRMRAGYVYFRALHVSRAKRSSLHTRYQRIGPGV